MPFARCCGTSVGVIVDDLKGRTLMIERGWFPAGIAPVAGHILDEHTDPAAALVAEVREEVGLEVTSHVELWRGWLPNLCASPPAQPIPGHHWVLASATTTGDRAPDPEETRGAAWYSPVQVRALARRTLLYAHGDLTDEEFADEPGLEPVWLELLHTASRLRISEKDRTLLRRLYTTPPEHYWLDGHLEPAAQAATA